MHNDMKVATDNHYQAQVKRWSQWAVTMETMTGQRETEVEVESHGSKLRTGRRHSDKTTKQAKGNVQIGE